MLQTRTSVSPKKRTTSSLRSQGKRISKKAILTDTLPNFGDGVVKRRSKKISPLFRGVLIASAIVIIVGVFSYGVSGNQWFAAQGFETGQYQAVFLNTGQVYFGTIRSEDSENLILDNVFYIQMVEQVLPPLEEGGDSRTVSQPQLIKKGDEFYTPSNTIRINRDQVTIIEELQEGSDIVSEIKARL